MANIMRQHKLHLMSHYIGGLPVQRPTLSVAEGWRVRMVKRPELGFKFSFVYGEEDSAWERDAAEATDSFLKIETPEQALAVLTAYGPLDLEHDYFSFRKIQSWQRGVWQIRTSSVKELEQIRKRIQDSSDKSLDDRERMILFTLLWPPNVRIHLFDPPSLSFGDANDLITAIKIVLHLEKLQGIRHRFCSLPSCNKPFALMGNREQKYCSYECSHKAAVRASRKRAKEGK
jgi:hypothetical protein